MDRKRVVSFGEVMLRLKAPYGEMLFQSPKLEASFGGCEANVVVSLANYGHKTGYITTIPDNALSDAFVSDLRGMGVCCRGVQRQADSRFGIYFVEPGAMQRPSIVVYDRAWSAFAQADPAQYDWKKLLEGYDWFHSSGITPAVSREAADALLAAVKAAKDLGMTVSLDLNYRGKLWKYGQKAQDVMAEIMPYVDVCIANEGDCQAMLGIDVAGVAGEGSEGGDLGAGEALHRRYEAIAAAVMERYPQLTHVAISLRDSVNANINRWSACLKSRDNFVVSPNYELTDIVDRVGGGDSFAGGLIHGLTEEKGEQFAIDYAVAASCLKHSILGDYNRVKEADVLSLMKSGGSGRIDR